MYLWVRFCGLCSIGGPDRLLLGPNALILSAGEGERGLKYTWAATYLRFAIYT